MHTTNSGHIEGEGSKRDIEEDLLGHPASPTPKAAVTLSEQQPYTDRLQCWGAVSSGRDVAEIADEVKTKREGRWEMAQGEKEEHQHLSDCGGEGLVGGIRQHNLRATCNFLPTMRLA